VSCAPLLLAVDGYRVHAIAATSGVPRDPARYPHLAFDDGEAYLVGSQWIYRDSTYGWVVFDEEPPTLRSFRERTYAMETHAAR